MAELIAIVVLVGISILIQKKNYDRRIEWKREADNKMRSDFSKSLGAVWHEDGTFLGFKDDMETVERNRKIVDNAKREVEMAYGRKLRY